MICVYAPTDETEEETKDEFYEHLENTYDSIPQHDVKIVIGDVKTNFMNTWRIHMIQYHNMM